MAKKLGIAALVLVLLVAAGGFWLWSRLTALPDWYEGGDMIAEDGSPQVDRDWVRVPDQAEEAAGPDYQLRNPHLRSETPTPVEKAIKASRATYSAEDESLEAGAVVNLAEVDTDSLKPEEREEFEKAVDAFPALTGRDVYVGVEGGVKGKDGKLALGPDTRLRVGDTRYSLAKAAKRLGMSEQALRKQIERELARMNLELPE